MNPRKVPMLPMAIRRGKSHGSEAETLAAFSDEGVRGVRDRLEFADDLNQKYPT